MPPDYRGNDYYIGCVFWLNDLEKDLMVLSVFDYCYY